MAVLTVRPLGINPFYALTKDFFATVQNKFHFAITGQTAAEIIDAKADKSEPSFLWTDEVAG